ncbi:NAD(P)/FAD-dependent oxidoreductase [Actinophytocola sp.]|uniref:FAD-dependent oxidoreductase n=1 Tax=Actinophytocola sp. TaxID=1872138 RepID=UPI002D5ACDE2|nr:NAD(P)/FAD-dependent oxidoreductase [Actinophytocola sp.]HYQ62468.1 NAD(P)/FAD-dependent oxidoreductase [Actinophytocola sp.]
MADAEVAVIGAGPVGLTAALALARRGVPVTVFEQATELSTEWRASTFHPPTIEIARHLGIADTMIEAGLVAPRYQVRDRRDGLIAEFDFGALADETEYPYRLQLEQYKYTQIIRAALEADHPDVTIRMGSGLTDLRESGDHVVVTAGDKSTTASWVLAADGASSTVRKALGFPFEGLTYEHRYLVLSIDHPIETLLPGICHVNYIADPVEHLLVLKVPDVWRVVVAVPPHVSADEAVSDAYVGARLEALFGRPDLVLRERKTYAVHQRVVDSFRHGRVLLLGDAAHVNSPMGGMGLNGGIHDAFDLSVQLTGFLDGTADETALDLWATRRRKAAVETVQRITHRTTTALAEGDELERQRFQRQMQETVADPERAKAWMMDAAMISNARAYDLPPRGRG